MRRLLSALPVLLCLIAVHPLYAWHDEGHAYAARAAVEALPDEVPAFFRGGEKTIAHCALDPDVFKSRRLPQLKAAQSPEHFIDLEMLQGHDLPATRYGYISLCEKIDVKPQYVGTLPYAITEWAQKLTMAFAEYRQHSGDAPIHKKCLVYAGLLAHYTADLEQPLHTTVDYDGRVKRESDGSFGHSPHTGIHAKVDDLPAKLPYDVLFREGVPAPQAHADIFTLVNKELARSHALVGRVYKLKAHLPAMHDEAIHDPSVRRFTIERMRASGRFTASVLLSAWRKSADIEPPHWLHRERYDAARATPAPHPTTP